MHACRPGDFYPDRHLIRRWPDGTIAYRLDDAWRDAFGHAPYYPAAYDICERLNTPGPTREREKQRLGITDRPHLPPGGREPCHAESAKTRQATRSPTSNA